jgi:hypothetical protein
MKRISLVVLSMLLAPPLFADAGQQLIPAGSLVSCTTGDAKISSRTTAVGDPVLCKVEHRRGNFMLPYGSYLGGEFSEYKDPGHFVGKGWMQLDFDRLYVGDRVFPIDAKVVDVPGYKIDAQGRILGKGHAVRDTVLWMIPVLWPIDLINLPRRGPRPTLKAETALTLRVMEDIQVPQVPEPQRDPNGLYQRSPNAYVPEPPPPTQEPDTNPEQSYAPPEQPAAPPPAEAYAAPVPYPVPVPYYVPPVVMGPYLAGFAYGYCRCGYGGFGFGVWPGMYAYSASVYAGVRPYAYAPRAVAPARPYAYGYANRGVATRGYAPGGTMMASRGGMGYARAGGRR